MKSPIKKIYLIFFLASIILAQGNGLAKENTNFSKNDFSNYLSGIISYNQYIDEKAFKYFNKVKFAKNAHKKFNIKFLYTLVLLEKFDEAFSFAKKIEKNNELFFEADLLLGINYFIKQDYLSAQKYFNKINKNSDTNFIFSDFLGDILTIWNMASKNKKDDAYKLFNSIPERYYNLKKVQNIFLSCYFDLPDTEQTLKKIIEEDDGDFSRFHYFYVNYLISKNEMEKAKIAISKSRINNDSNLLLKQTENSLLGRENINVVNFFNCEDPKDAIAEFFYIIANVYSTEKNYQLSNFYLKIALFLNEKFRPYKVLLAENYYHQNRIKMSKKTFQSIRSLGSVYSWHASKSIAAMLSDKKKSITILEKELNSLTIVDYENYYELANFYNENEYYEKSIKYYSSALKSISKNHSLVSKILFRRGTSYERSGDWENAEKDLSESLALSPDEPNVLNYLAYSWVEKRINLNKSLEMLRLADKLKENDGYIIDSLGWAHYAIGNYSIAKKILQKAIQLMPQDPVINDHYADTLWMLNKDIQARYFWDYALNLEKIETELKNKIKLKLIFGINQNL